MLFAMKLFSLSFAQIPDQNYWCDTSATPTGTGTGTTVTLFVQGKNKSVKEATFSWDSRRENTVTRSH
jgi:hypothetical protein